MSNTETTKDGWRQREMQMTTLGIPSPAAKLDWSQRRFSHCQAWEDGCDYDQCPRWWNGEVVNEAHCALDLIGRDEDV